MSTNPFSAAQAAAAGRAQQAHAQYENVNQQLLETQNAHIARLMEENTILAARLHVAKAAAKQDKNALKRSLKAQEKTIASLERQNLDHRIERALSVYDAPLWCYTRSMNPQDPYGAYLGGSLSPEDVQNALATQKEEARSLIASGRYVRLSSPHDDVYLRPILLPWYTSDHSEARLIASSVQGAAARVITHPRPPEQTTLSMQVGRSIIHLPPCDEDVIGGYSGEGNRPALPGYTWNGDCLALTIFARWKYKRIEYGTIIHE